MENLEDIEGNFPSPAKQELVVVPPRSKLSKLSKRSKRRIDSSRGLIEERVPSFLVREVNEGVLVEDSLLEKRQ